MERIKWPSVWIEKNIILELYRNPPKDGRVICLDELGPLEVRPQPGENWGYKPDLIPATYNRDHGVRHLIAIFDLSSNKLYGHIKKRKRWYELLQFLKYIRSLYDGKLYIVLDNFKPHIKEEVTSWCNENDIQLVFLPTNASWLNRIECHFTALKKFAIRNSNYQSHRELGSAIRRYVIWRNKNVENKTIKKIENARNFSWNGTTLFLSSIRSLVIFGYLVTAWK